eukprot:TRINITY_DN11945_c0_g1_i1.p1 TRINITY_DN11945_c0_g1~~TRINITY_DN11945_c0_g1_i1.p1  ORF type:complete len:368 (-),score=62.14 TRINITY_DN11945_c0_g1_i1:49-1152(-)
MAQNACEQYKQENVVCPSKLKYGLFTTAAIDNIDHNPGSTTAHDSFHGTGISLFQHPTESIKGTERQCTVHTGCAGSRTIPDLPAFYTDITPVVLKTPIEPPETPPSTPHSDMNEQFANAVVNELQWLDTVHSAMTEDTTPENLSWGAYHSALQGPEIDQTPAISCLLPLFHDPSKSPAMIKHGMDVIKRAVDHLNSGQVPVVALDQPLYAIAKQIQWKWPDSHGEKQFVVMLGGLHTEMAFLKALGNLLRDSGWTDTLVEANIASTGTADSFINASHVTKTRRAHQFSACALYSLITKAYKTYVVSAHRYILLFDDRQVSMAEKSPTFHFWCLILQLELLLLVFVSSLRDGNFSLYVQSLTIKTLT